METLLEELLSEIFSYLNYDDLCQLTLTCKSFNNIISNNSRLMDKFCLKYTKSNDITVGMMPRRKYRRILITSVDESFMKFLEIVQISAENIRVDTNYLYSSNKVALVDFLRSQKQLKTLELLPYCSELFNNDSLANVDFQLKTFTADFGYFRNLNIENFKKFLKNQKSLRKIIEVNNRRISQKHNFLNILIDFENIKELKVSGRFNFFSSLPQIEKLAIDAVYLANLNIHDIFPNVKNLSIYSMYRIKFVNNFTESLSNDCIELKISENVKTLTVKNIKFRNDGLFDDDFEVKIENLTLHYCNDIDWLIDCFKNDQIKLKSLTIKIEKIKKSQREYLESLTQGEDKKIKELKICMPMKLNENHDYVCDYQIEN